MLDFKFSFLFLCSLLNIASFAEASKSLSGFSIDLIPSHSPLSPVYNPSLTPSERIRKAVLSSIARSKRLGLSRNENGFSKTITIPDPFGGYLMKYYIGTPPVERFALADTGSDLIWVQCTPCVKCIPQNAPLFDPRKSSTYRRVGCDSQPCTLLPKNQHACGESGECKYKYAYGDKSYNIGILGVEKISFSSKGVSDAFPKFTFGCAYYNDDTDKNKMNTGLVGLGVGPLSLISQLRDQIGGKFSYCFPPLDSNSTSKMKFGNEATIEGSKGVMSTPLILKPSSPSFYYLNLEAISIGNKKVKINKGQTDGNILIDSGTTYPVLEQGIYNKFVTLVKEVYGVEAEKNPPTPHEFCFRNSDTSENFPDVVFHFTGAKVRVDPVNLFGLAEENLICTLVSSTSDEDGSIFGNQATVGYQVEYDLAGEKVSFAPADCTEY